MRFRGLGVIVLKVTLRIAKSMVEPWGFPWGPWFRFRLSNRVGALIALGLTGAGKVGGASSTLLAELQLCR